MAGLNAALICSFAALPTRNQQQIYTHLDKALAPWCGRILMLSLKRVRTFLVSRLAGGDLRSHLNAWRHKVLCSTMQCISSSCS